MIGYQLNKFIEDTQALMNEQIDIGNGEHISTNLPQDFSIKHTSSSCGSQQVPIENQQLDNFDASINSVSGVNANNDKIKDENAHNNESYLKKLSNALNGIGETIANGSKALCFCSKICNEKESPRYDLANLPSGLDVFFDANENADQLNSDAKDPETYRSTMTSHILTGVPELFQSPRPSNNELCLNPFALCTLNNIKTKLLPQSNAQSPAPGNLSKGPNTPITYKLHAIEIHQPISNFNSKDFNPAKMMPDCQAMLKKGLEHYDPELSLIPATTMTQIIQQHKTLLKKC